MNRVLLEDPRRLPVRLARVCLSVLLCLSVVSPVIALRSTWHKGVLRRVYDVRDQGGEPEAISDCMQMNACAENCIISGSRRGVGGRERGCQG